MEATAVDEVEVGHGTCQLPQGSSRARRRLLRVAATRWRLGVEQRRSRRRRRRLIARGHPVRRPADPSHARRHADGDRRWTDHHGREHSRQRRSLVREPARQGRRDHRLVGRGRGDAGARPGAGRAPARGTRRGRSVRPGDLRPVRLVGLRGDVSEPNVRRPPRPRGRRCRGAVDRGRACPHRGRRPRLRSVGEDDLRRRHPVHRRNADHLGGTVVELGRGVRPDARPRRRAGRAGTRPGHGQGRDPSSPRLPDVRRRARRGQRHAAGMSAEEAIADIALGEYGSWSEHGRLAPNVFAVYHELDPTLRRPTS